MSDNYQTLKYTDRDLDSVYKLAQKYPLEKIREILSSNPDGRTLTTQDVIYATSKVLNIHPDKISFVGKQGDAIYAKQIARYIAYYYTRESGNRIAEDVGHCHHATMYTGRKVIHDRLPFDWQLREHLRMVLGYLRSSNFKLEYRERSIGVVGHKATPASYVKGQCGNPNGRPKKLKADTI